MKNNLRNEYFEWMYRLVCGREPYRKLLYFLFRTEFTYTVDMDGNRAEDGIDLRYRFANEHDIKGSTIAAYLDDQPCSVLEMMTALAIRCEEHIMDNPDIGDRTAQWFWGMVKSLGLDGMTDEAFDRPYAASVIRRFLDRKYKKNGEGGLFTIRHGRVDMRNVEIWYQAMWYLDEVLKN